MKSFYYLLGVIAIAMLVWPRQAAAQATVCPTDQDECVVEWGDEYERFRPSAIWATEAETICLAD